MEATLKDLYKELKNRRQTMLRGQQREADDSEKRLRAKMEVCATSKADLLEYQSLINKGEEL